MATVPQTMLEVVKNGPAQVTSFGLSVTPETQRATVADASVAHALNATFSDVEVEAALNALGVKVNAILATLEAFGFHATA